MSENSEKKRATINTVQRSVYVARLAIPRYRNYTWYIPYDLDNLYPNKIKTIAERSVSTMTAIGTHSDFLSGQGFGEGINEVSINSENQTLEEILIEKCFEYSTFLGVALHFNYNREGLITEINEIAYENLRWSKDMKRLYYFSDWSKIGNNKSRVIEYRPFNPENAVAEMEEVGIENYTGQVMYFIKRKKDIYTTCRFDAAVNDAQFEDESSVHKLSSIQNDYAIGGVMKIPSILFDDEEQSDIIETLKGMKGAQGASSWHLIPIANEEQFKGRLFESTARQNIDGFFKTQNEQAKSNIYEAYQQPPILNGKSFGGMFNQDQFIDAFDYYNSKTEGERTVIEKIFNKFWPYTIWYNGEKLEIIPKEYMMKRDITNENTSE